MDEMTERWNHAIREHRMGTLLVHTAPGDTVSVRQLRHEFRFGTALSWTMFDAQKSNVEDRERYQDIARTHFNAAVQENCLKWYHTEPAGPGSPNYADADRMLEWCEENGLTMRGHTLFWAVPKFHKDWVKGCEPDELRAHMERRCREIVRRYRGRIDEFDVNNEMLHGRFFRDRLGDGIVPDMFRWARLENPDAALYVNDYNLLTGRDSARCVELVRQLQGQGVNIDGVGCQGHFGSPQALETVELKLNRLAELGLPITVTEFDIRNGSDEEKASFLDRFYRLCFSHPSMAGVFMWGFWEGRHWIPSAALWKRDWTPTPMAKAYEKLVLDEWWTHTEAQADDNGLCRIRAFYGEHRISANGYRLDVHMSRADGPEFRVDLIRPDGVRDSRQTR